MDTILRSVLRREGVQVVLRNAKLQERLIFHTIEFLDRNDKYKRLQLVYNQADIYCAKGKYFPLSQNLYSLVDIIRAEIKVYDTKEEFITSRTTGLTQEKVNYLFDKLEGEIMDDCMSVQSSNFKVRSVSISWYPVNTLIIHFNFKKRRQQPLVVTVGRPTALSSSNFIGYEDEYKEFIERLCKDKGGVVWI